MRKNEQRIWDTMRRNAPKSLWLERVENLVGDGIPDVRSICAGKEIWLELKYASLPKRSTTPLLTGAIRPGQKNWHEKQHKFGGKSYILVRDSTQQLYLIPGKLVREVENIPWPELRQKFGVSSWPELFGRIK